MHAAGKLPLLLAACGCSSADHLLHSNEAAIHNRVVLYQIHRRPCQDDSPKVLPIANPRLVPWLVTRLVVVHNRNLCEAGAMGGSTKSWHKPLSCKLKQCTWMLDIRLQLALLIAHGRDQC